MKATFRRVVSAIRVWLGWGDLSTERVSPAHGWLLPRPSYLHARHAAELVPVVVPARRSERQA
jgi:hypothetical protein